MGRHSRKGAAPVRTGVLGACAVVAVGAVAVAAGVLPTDEFGLSDSGSSRAEHTPEPQGEPIDPPWHPTEESSSPVAPKSSSASPGKPEPEESASPEKPRKPAGPSTTPSGSAEKPEKPEQSGAPSEPPSARPESSAPTEPATPPVPEPSGDAAAQVLALVNEERSGAGCSPVRADAELASLATKFSADMEARNFFDHTDPDGRTPWDRAEAAGVEGVGGENIARGQTSAAAVMDAWMNSEGHRANILNCSFTTMGLGFEPGDEGPWWTQEFGY